MYLVILLYALFGSVFTIGKTGLEFSQPFFLVGSRMFLAGILILAYVYFFKRNDFVFRRKDVWKVLGLALFNIYLTNVFEFWGLKYLTSFKTCFIYSLSPFVSALLSYFIFSEKMNLKKWVGLMIGFIGFVPILVNHTMTEEETGHLLFFSWAELAVMGAAVTAVYGWILLRKLVKEDGYTSFMANGLSMFFGGIMALAHSLAIEDWDPIPVTRMMPFVECTILLIIISNFICYNLYGYLLKRYSATFVSFAGFITPLFSALFGWYYLGEQVTAPFYLSAAIVFMGLFIFYQEELKQDYELPVRAES